MAGIECWLAPRDIPQASNHNAEIGLAISGAAGTIVLLSENANRSSHLVNEVWRASTCGKALYPVRIENVEPRDELAYHLATRPYSELWVGSSEREQHIRNLIEQLKVLISPEWELPVSLRGRNAMCYLSHSAMDRPSVLRFESELAAHGIICWTAPRDVPSGHSEGASIREAIRNTPVTVLAVPSQPEASPSVTLEIDRAIADGKKVVAVLLSDFQPSLDLGQLISKKQIPLFRIWEDRPERAENFEDLVAQIRNCITSR